MRAAPKACAVVGCGAVVPLGQARCARHRRAADLARGSRQQRGYGPQHDRWRALVLARDVWCVRCLERGVQARASVADHVQALRQGGSFDLANGQGLCASCHAKKTYALDGGLGRPPARSGSPARSPFRTSAQPSSPVHVSDPKWRT